MITPETHQPRGSHTRGHQWDRQRLGTLQISRFGVEPGTRILQEMPVQGLDQEKPCSCLGWARSHCGRQGPRGLSQGAGEQGSCRAHPVQGVARTDLLLSPSGDGRGASGFLGPGQALPPRATCAWNFVVPG